MQIEVVSQTQLQPKAETPKEEKVTSAPVEETEQNAAADSEPVETEEKEIDESEDMGDEPESTGESDKPRKEGGFQRRIKKLSAQKAEALREAEYWKSQAMKQGATEQPKADTPKLETKQEPADGKPNPDSFETHAEYVEALTDWKLEQREKARAAEAEKTKVLEAQQNALKSHYEREKQFAEKTKDYQEAIEDVGGFGDISPVLGQLIVESENGPALMYALAKNPDEYKRINALGPTACAHAIGMMEAKITQSSEKPKVETKTKTNAPKPIAPVGNGTSGSIKNPNDMSYEEYKVWRSENFKRK